MAERNPIPLTASKIEWNTNPTNPETDPAAQRAAGWAVDEVPDAQEFNYVWTMQGDYFEWLRSYLPREWTELSEGIDATSYRDLFRVAPPSTGIAARFENKFTLTGTASGGGTVYYLTTDGEQLYYMSGATTTQLVVASPVDGSEIVEKTIAYTVPGLTADGESVYLGGNAANPGLRKYDRSGNFVAAAGVEYGHNLLRSNGVYAVGALQATNPNRITFWTVATPTETGQANDADPVLALGIDDTFCYTAATNAVTPAHIDAWVLTTRASAWTTNFPTTSQPAPTGIAADGKYVYCVADLQTLSAGGDVNLYCFDRSYGTLLWTKDIAGADLINVAVDDQYVWVVDSAGGLYQIHKNESVPSIVWAQATALATVVSDGVCVYGTDAGDTDDLTGLHIGEPTKTYMRVDGDDPNRHPFYQLALPV